MHPIPQTMSTTVATKAPTRSIGNRAEVEGTADAAAFAASVSRKVTSFRAALASASLCNTAPQPFSHSNPVFRGQPQPPQHPGSADTLVRSVDHCPRHTAVISTP